ncbi:MAG: NAD(P)-binding domain-containing protein [Saprospiraceae bacterium]|nr:NAD(P)-binding domain-containing protein [Saprospiraceae bacterium]
MKKLVLLEVEIWVLLWYKVFCLQMHLTVNDNEQPEKLADLHWQFVKISSDNQLAVNGMDIIILAVLPQQINVVLEEIKDWLKPGQMLISLVSGVSIDEIRTLFQKKLSLYVLCQICHCYSRV